MPFSMFPLLALQNYALLVYIYIYLFVLFFLLSGAPAAQQKKQPGAGDGKVGL